MHGESSTDYRLILKHALDRYASANGIRLQKQLAILLHMSPSLMVRVFRLERNIPLHTIDQILNLEILDKKEKVLFLRDYIAQMLPAESVQKFIRTNCTDFIN